MSICVISCLDLCYICVGCVCFPAAACLVPARQKSSVGTTSLDGPEWFVFVKLR